MNDYTGPERRAMSAFEREVIKFMARVDQRNIDHDIQSAARDEVSDDLEIRVRLIEELIIYVKASCATGLKALTVISGVLTIVYSFVKSFGFHISKGN